MFMTRSKMLFSLLLLVNIQIHTHTYIDWMENIYMLLIWTFEIYIYFSSSNAETFSNISFLSLLWFVCVWVVSSSRLSHTIKLIYSHISLLYSHLYGLKYIYIYSRLWCERVRRWPLRFLYIDRSKIERSIV